MGGKGAKRVSDTRDGLRVSGAARLGGWERCHFRRGGRGGGRTRGGEVAGEVADLRRAHGELPAALPAPDAALAALEHLEDVIARGRHRASPLRRARGGRKKKRLKPARHERAERRKPSRVRTPRASNSVPKAFDTLEGNARARAPPPGPGGGDDARVVSRRTSRNRALVPRKKPLCDRER